jgi:hypothetical protein
MTEPAATFESLARRIETLERSRRAVSWGAAAALALALFLLLVQILEAVAPAPTELEADAVVLRDLRDVERARLELGPEGEPQLLLQDREGSLRARLGLDASGMPTLQMRDGEDRVRAGIGLLPDGRPTVVLTGAEGGQPRAQLEVLPEGAGRIVVRDPATGKSFEAP